MGEKRGGKKGKKEEKRAIKGIFWEAAEGGPRAGLENFGPRIFLG